MKRVLLLPALLVVSTFLPWVVVTGFMNIESTAFDLDVAPLLIGAALIVSVSSLYHSAKYRIDGLLVGGVLVELVSLWTLWDLNRGIAEFTGSASGELLADSVSFSYGMGLYLALFVGAVLIMIGLREYLTSPDDFVLPKAIGALSKTI